MTGLGDNDSVHPIGYLERKIKTKNGFLNFNRVVYLQFTSPTSPVSSLKSENCCWDGRSRECDMELDVEYSKMLRSFSVYLIMP